MLTPTPEDISNIEGSYFTYEMMSTSVLKLINFKDTTASPLRYNKQYNTFNFVNSVDNWYLVNKNDNGTIFYTFGRSEKPTVTDNKHMFIIIDDNYTKSYIYNNNNLFSRSIKDVIQKLEVPVIGIGTDGLSNGEDDYDITYVDGVKKRVVPSATDIVGNSDNIIYYIWDAWKKPEL